LQDHQEALKWVRNEALLAYIRTGNAVGAIGVLSDGADPDATTKWGASALHLTCVDRQDYTDRYYENVRAGSTRIAAELLAKGADVNAKDRGGATPLHKAIRLHDREKVELFLAEKARLDLTDDEGNTPLHIAAALKGAGGREIAKALLDASGKSQLVAKNLQGLTPVDIAKGWEGDQSIALLLAQALDKAEE
jgi:ankyrin repeat protein